MSEEVNEENNEENGSGNIKIVLIGEMATGKTSLINAYLGLSFSKNVDSTLTPSVSQKEIQINDATYLINMWDTAGQEQYRSMTKIFIKGSQIVIFVYDVTKENTFKELDYWVKSVEEYLGKEPILGVCGNKTDLFDQQEVDRENGEKYAKDIGALFRETSAKDDAKGFRKFVKELIEELLDKKGIFKKEGERISIVKPDKKKKKNCQC